MRKFNKNDRIAATLEIAKKRRQSAVEYPQPRKCRELILREEGEDDFIITMEPKGSCTQWSARFPNGAIVFGGMTKVLAEFKRQNPPMLGVSSL